MKYRKRRFWKYQLHEDEVYVTDILPEKAIDTAFLDMTVDGVLTVRKNYTWDGASGPSFDSKSTFSASLIHDALYNLMRENLLDRRHRKRVDQIFYEILISRGMSKFRARIWYRAVRKGAANAAKHDVLTAP